MTRMTRWIGRIALALGFALAATANFAQPAGTAPGMMPGMNHSPGMRGGGMGGPAAMLTRQDAQSAADMDIVHALLFNHDKIKRTVTNLPDGIRTVTESADPQTAQAIQVHVAAMSKRLEDGREFNIFSTTLPVLFANRDKIVSRVEMTDTGSIVTRTSTDPSVVAALQAHAAEVTELARDGMVAMHRGMMARMAMGPGGPRPGMPGSSRGNPLPTAPDHQH